MTFLCWLFGHKFVKFGLSSITFFEKCVRCGARREQNAHSFNEGKAFNARRKK